MSRPQKLHPPLPFTFNQVLAEVGRGNGVSKPLPKSKPQRAASSSIPKPKNSK
jgi:hypothetical protein